MVFFHAGVSAFSGGYVGVDVFFVISGFVITGVLLRERAATGRTSILAFYGRRCRRIVPAATVVIVVTVALSYGFLGIDIGGQTANDGRWAAFFLANFHFIAIGTSYLGSQRPPSPLQNLWSLSVEEQFYVIYPTLFLFLAGLRGRLSLRARLAIGLVAIIAGSLFFSIIDTANNATSAYFSPLTRAWELALGALVAVGTPWLLKVPARWAAMATWLGLGAVVVASVFFTSATPYPGSAVMVPVVGAALIIAGGMRESRFGAEAILRLAPLRGLGKISYSLYLWHWPILIIAAEYAGKQSLSVPQNLGWVLVALVASVLTYFLVENPIRHARPLLRAGGASVGLGAVLIATTVGVIALQTTLNAPAGGVSAVGGTTATSGASNIASTQVVLRLVAASNRIQKIPTNLIPPFAQVVNEDASVIGFPSTNSGCWPTPSQTTVPACTFGDRTGADTMVLYGDSHAAMWFAALDEIAKRAHWRLIVLTKGSCPAAPLSTHLPGLGSGVWAACDQWHRYAIKRINRIDPDLLIVSQSPTAQTPNRMYYPPSRWGNALAQLLRVTHAHTKMVIGNLPVAGGPPCIARYVDNVQACSRSPLLSFWRPYNEAEASASAGPGVRYINVTSWFCAKTCSSIIGNYDVYVIGNHVTKGYSLHLEGVLARAIDLQIFGQPNVRH